MKELSQALINLSTSPVKADREAIKRIEMEMRQPITETLTELDDLALVKYSPKNLKREKLKQISQRLLLAQFLASLIGTIYFFLAGFPSGLNKLKIPILLGFSLGLTAPRNEYD